MSIVIYVIFLFAYIFFPIPLQIVAFVINVFVSDPIPIVDEVLMVYSMLKKADTALNVFSFIERAIEVWSENKIIVTGGLILFFIIIFQVIF